MGYELHASSDYSDWFFTWSLAWLCGLGASGSFFERASPAIGALDFMELAHKIFECGVFEADRELNSDGELGRCLEQFTRGFVGAQCEPFCLQTGLSLFTAAGAEPR